MFFLLTTGNSNSVMPRSLSRFCAPFSHGPALASASAPRRGAADVRRRRLATCSKLNAVGGGTSVSKSIPARRSLVSPFGNAPFNTLRS